MRQSRRVVSRQSVRSRFGVRAKLKWLSNGVEELAFTITNMSAIWGVPGEIATASLRAMRAATAGLDQIDASFGL